MSSATDHGVAPASNLTDVDGAQRRGLRGIWIDRPDAGLGDSPIRPYRIIRSLRDLMA